MKHAIYFLLLFGTLLLNSAVVLAQHDDLFDEEAGEQPLSEGAQAELEKLDEGTGELANSWDGPRVEVGYEYFNLNDGRGAGATHMVMFGGFLPVIPRLRAGLSLMGGIRDFSYQENDLFLGARAIVGYQHTDWNGVLPYVGATLTGGVLIGERFESPVAYGLIGVGIEGGLDVRIVETFYAGFGIGYTRADLDGLSHDMLIVRLRVGL